MGILTSLKNLVHPTPGMLCPRCEKPLEGHDEAACERRMSRRYFFGVAAGVATAIAGAKAVPDLYGGGPLQEFVVTGEFTSGIAIARYNDRLANVNYMDAWDRASEMLKVGDIFTMAGVYQPESPPMRFTAQEELFRRTYAK